MTTTADCIEPVPGVFRLTRCVCGAALPPRGIGRPRLSCSPRCSRDRELLIRKQRYRVECLAEWRAELARHSDGLSGYPRARIRAELRQLREELAALDRQLKGGLPC